MQAVDDFAIWHACFNAAEAGLNIALDGGKMVQLVHACGQEADALIHIMDHATGVQTVNNFSELRYFLAHNFKASGAGTVQNIFQTIAHGGQTVFKRVELIHTWQLADLCFHLCHALGQALVDRRVNVFFCQLLQAGLDGCMGHAQSIEAVFDVRTGQRRLHLLQLVAQFLEQQAIAFFITQTPNDF